MSLTQSGNYPLEKDIRFQLSAAGDCHFPLQLRIPAWARDGAVIRVNGRRVHAATTNGFASVKRTWRNGDSIELDLPLPMRLEAIGYRQPNTAAVLSGPLVLFAITDKQPALTRSQVLTASKSSPNEWRVNSENGSLLLMPFSAITEQTYSTYLRFS